MPINAEQTTGSTITAIVIDDENNSREVLIKKLHTHCPEVNILANCKDAAEGTEAINLYKPQIVFLDIEMPRMNGFTMLQQLPVKNFHLIFTTAYNQYAIEAIRFSAFDYLVKPIDTGELVRAVNRVKENHHNSHIDNKLAIMMDHLLKEKTVISKIAVATMESIDYIALNDIVYLEAVGNYTNLHIYQTKLLLSSKNLKEFEDILPTNQFCRIHNAIIVNVAYLQKFIKGGDGGQLVLQNGVVLDVARRRKEDLLQLMATFAARV
jgi:two-component system LytT family response regulator